MLTRAEFLSLLASHAASPFPSGSRGRDHGRAEPSAFRLDVWRNCLRVRLAELLPDATALFLFDGSARHETALPAGYTPDGPGILLPLPAAPRFRLEVRSRAGTRLAERECGRWFQPIGGIRGKAESEPAFDLVPIDGDDPDRTYRRIAQRTSALKRDDPAPFGLSLLFVFERGWRYTLVAPRETLAVPEGAVELRFWLLTDGLASDDLRAWYRDAEGQTFQKNLGDAFYHGWREFAVPLDGRHEARWGGKADGVMRGKLTVPAMLLADSVLRQAHAVRMIVAQPYFALKSPDLPPLSAPIPRPKDRAIEDDYPLRSNATE